MYKHTHKYYLCLCLYNYHAYPLDINNNFLHGIHIHIANRGDNHHDYHVLTTNIQNTATFGSHQ